MTIDQALTSAYKSELNKFTELENLRKKDTNTRKELQTLSDRNATLSHQETAIKSSIVTKREDIAVAESEYTKVALSLRKKNSEISSIITKVNEILEIIV